MCGAAPIPASSGKTTRHRLNRGGNRQANWALYMLVVGRMGWDPPTRAYVARRTTEGLAKPDIIRCLKRYLGGVKKQLPAFEPLPVKCASGVECEHDAYGEGNEACRLRRSTNAGAARAGGVKPTLAVSTTVR